MLDFLWLIPALPLAGFVILTLFGSRLPKGLTAVVGCGSVGLSAIMTLLIANDMIAAEQMSYHQTLWTWLDVGGFTPAIAFRLDALSLLMVAVVTGVGFLIHLYSTEFMSEEAGYSRFFAYMNLFISAMLILVLADNLLLLYLGWEGVGLCSFLLIGFWYRDPANGLAARKAFIVTRIGDAAFALGLFLLFASLGTLDMQALMTAASTQWAVGEPMAVAATTLLLIGAIGKSAQLPLQTWLPDAMAGPTPVSALIHAATMVTAGVYLIARLHGLFLLAPVVMGWIAVIGAVTLLFAGFSALVQTDIKRVLAYSTISQIGYMFLALGVGAWSAAMFHFMTHAFFKALLFLGAGAVILAMDHEHNMFKMGGLWRKMPLTFWTFLAGVASLAALPLITAGFYSKDLILWRTWIDGNALLWLAALLGAFLTAFYTTRMVIITFLGKPKMEPTHRLGWRIQTPLVILALFSIIGGFVELPHTLGDFTPFSDWLHSVLPAASSVENLALEGTLQGIASVATLIGAYGAYLFYVQRQYARWLHELAITSRLRRLWYNGWHTDRVYDAILVRPYGRFASFNKDDWLDTIPTGLAHLSEAAHHLLSQTQTGRVRTYALSIVVGVVLVTTLVVIL